MSERLIPRVNVATPSSLGLTVPAYIERNGLAIHDYHGSLDAPKYTITGTATGRAVAHFERLLDAEAAFVELESIADWPLVTNENAREVGPRAKPILLRHHAIRTDLRNE